MQTAQTRLSGRNPIWPGAGLFRVPGLGRTSACCFDYGIPLYSPISTMHGICRSFSARPRRTDVYRFFVIKVTSRWLASKDSYEEALQYLAYVRNKRVNHAEVQKEAAEIRTSIEDELAETEGSPGRNLWIRITGIGFSSPCAHILAVVQRHRFNWVYAPQTLDDRPECDKFIPLSFGVYGTVSLSPQRFFCPLGRPMGLMPSLWRCCLHGDRDDSFDLS